MIDKAVNINLQKMIYQFLVIVLVNAFFAPAWAQEKSSVTPVFKQLFAQSSDTQITLRWKIDHADKLSLIRLYRKAYPLPLPAFKVNKGKDASIDKGELIAELKAGETRFVDKGVEAGHYYSYRIQLVNEQQPDGKLSAPAIAALKDKEPPRPPVLKSLTALDENQVEIRWQPSPSKDVVAYRIYRATQKGQPRIILRVDAHQGSQKIVKEVFVHRGNAEFEYRYALAAVDGAGNVSQKTGYKSLRMPDNIPPRPPSLLQARQKPGQLVLQWRASRENDIAGYRVYRRNANNKSSFTPVHKGLLDSNTFTDKSIRPLQGYYYRVAAVDRFSNESRATRGVLVRTSAFNTTPSAPESLRVNRNKQGLPHLRWRKSDVGTHAGFVVQRSDGRGFKTVSGLLRDVSFIDRSIRPDHAYRYRVRAIDTSGRYSPASNIVIWAGGKNE